MKLPFWAKDEVLYQYGFIELYWLYREWSNIITWRAVSIKTGRSNILSRLDVTVKWDAWTVFKYLPRRLRQVLIFHSNITSTISWIVSFVAGT